MVSAATGHAVLPVKIDWLISHNNEAFCIFEYFICQMEIRPELFDFHGVSMIKLFTSDWENIQNFKARPDDILIVTYPKAGRLQND